MVVFLPLITTHLYDSVKELYVPLPYCRVVKRPRLHLCLFSESCGKLTTVSVFFFSNCVMLRESLSRCSFTPSQVDKLVNMMKPVLPSLNVFILHVNKVKESAKKRETEEKLKVTV